MLRPRNLASLALLWLVLAASPAAAQNAADAAPGTRAEFEKLVLERAKLSSDATDHFAAFDNLYRYLVLARFMNRALYDRALQQLAATDGSVCDTPGLSQEPRAQLVCETNAAARALLSLTLFTEGVLFQRDAVTFAESIAGTDPEPLIDSLLALARSEWTHGSMADAEDALRRASTLMVSQPRTATRGRRMLVAVLRARLADARLDDAAAVSALSEAVDLLLSEDKRHVPGYAADFADGGLSELLMEHLRGRFCPKCGHPVAEPMQRWLTAALKSDSAAYSHSYRGGNLLLEMLVAPPGTVSHAELRTYARKFIAAQPPDRVEGVRKLLPPRASDLEAARMLLLSDALEGGSLRLLREPNPRRQMILMKKFLADVANHQFAQFGDDILIPEAFEDAAWHYEQGGLRNAARLTLQYLIDWQKERDAGDGPKGRIVKPHTVRQARVFVLALARLATLQLAAGDRAAAAKNLDDASAIAQAKLRGEWEQGGERAILTIRDLSAALQLIAQTRHQLLAPKGLAEKPVGADALFQAMQAAITGETALTLEVARQRRILSTPRLAELRRDHLRARAEAAGIAEIEERYKGFNFDGLITRARHEAEVRRDRAAVELGKLAAPPNASADLEPVSLEDARKSLADREAIVLLRVGDQTIDGFLLDRAGGTSVWRTTIARNQLEALVKSLRTGADMVTSDIPDFKLDDAARLHELIFGPVKARMAAYRKLIVLGGGPLQSLPYGILLIRKAEHVPRSASGFRAAALPWLVRTHAIALVPSVRSFVSQRSGVLASVAPHPFLGVGNPQFAAAGAGQRSIDVSSVFGKAGGLADVTRLRQLASLPETEEELRQIARVLHAGPDAVVVGGKATEAQVKALPLSDYRIIAFATHGALAGELAGTSEPGLVLTPPLQASAEDDGYLSLSEILGLKLDADLVILSACNTGTSDGRPRAESLSGLARGFFNAGARSLLVTHWTIPSDSAVRTTTGLVAARARDPAMDWSEALREATLAIIDREGPPEWAHPTFWGAYVAIGVLPAR